MNWQGFKHQLLHYVSLENWAAVNVIQPGQSVKASDWAGPLDTGPAQGMAYQGRSRNSWSAGHFTGPLKRKLGQSKRKKKTGNFTSGKSDELGRSKQSTWRSTAGRGPSLR